MRAKCMNEDFLLCPKKKQLKGQLLYFYSKSCVSTRKFIYLICNSVYISYATIYEYLITVRPSKNDSGCQQITILRLSPLSLHTGLNYKRASDLCPLRSQATMSNKCIIKETIPIQFLLVCASKIRTYCQCLFLSPDVPSQ